MRFFTRVIRKMTSDLLDLPQDVVFDLPRMTMIGNMQLYIENHHGVIDFSANRLLLNLSVGKLEISGEELVIRTISGAEVFVEGNVQHIHYLHTTN